MDGKVSGFLEVLKGLLERIKVSIVVITSNFTGILP